MTLKNTITKSKLSDPKPSINNDIKKYFPDLIVFHLPWTGKEKLYPLPFQIGCLRTLVTIK